MADCLKEKDMIISTDRDFYAYAIESMLLYIINFSTIFLLALLLGRVMETLIFVAAIKLLRTHSGGLHAKKWYTCYLASCVLMVAAVMAAQIVNLSIIAIIALCILSCVVVWKYAPMEHPNHPLEDNIRTLSRRKAILYSTGIAAGCILLCGLSLQTYANLLLTALCMNAGLLLISVLISNHCHSSEQR